MNDIHQKLGQGGSESSNTRISLLFSALTGAQAVLSMISAAALYADAVARGAPAEVFVNEVLKGYDIGAALAERLLKGELLHGFQKEALLLHLSQDEVSLLPETSTYVQLAS
ncbi:MAG: hypothetical protein EKK47_20115 [Burkholderiales bacterium]|nr:MAG: hypothetical protein EKK47_20115 [Burkholderiales bacterium]